MNKYKRKEKRIRIQNGSQLRLHPNAYEQSCQHLVFIFPKFPSILELFLKSILAEWPWEYFANLLVQQSQMKRQEISYSLASSGIRSHERTQ